MKGSTRKYVDKKCLLCSTKYIIVNKLLNNDEQHILKRTFHNFQVQIVGVMFSILK